MLTEPVTYMGASIPLWLVLFVAAVFVMFAFGWWPKAWAAVKWIIAKCGGTVSDSLNATMDALFIKSDSAVAQSELRMARPLYVKHGDKDDLEMIEKLLVKAATWIDEEA